MKKMLVVLTVVALLAVSLAACGGGGDGAPDENGGSAPVAAAYAGETFETDNFSIVVPDGWEYMEVDGGLQIYKASGEVLEVHYRGFNQGENHGKLQVESIAGSYGGTEVQEVELLGKTFWYTEYTANNKPQVFYALIEDGAMRDGEEKNGVMLSIKYAGDLTEASPTFDDILGTIVWK
jgi:hypothetical protein